MKFYRSGRDAMARLGLAAPEEMAGVEARFPVYVNEYYLGLIDPADWKNDPISRQALPDVAELADRSSSFDPLAEEEQMPVPRLIHRFEDRVVLLATGRCAMRCRFCFRKREWADGAELADISESELAAAAHYLAGHPEIHEVLISGGDPLMLPFPRLKQLVETIAALPSIEVIRIGSRMPVVWPERVTAEIAAFFSEVPGLWFATHFNHPREVTSEAAAACGRLIRAGVPVVNQSGGALPAADRHPGQAPLPLSCRSGARGAPLRHRRGARTGDSPLLSPPALIAGGSDLRHRSSGGGRQGGAAAAVRLQRRVLRHP